MSFPAVFSRSTQVASCHYQSVIEKCKFDLNEAEYWRNSDIEPDCWVINGVQIKQVCPHTNNAQVFAVCMAFPISNK